MRHSPSPPSLAESSALNFADGAISLASALIVSVLVARMLGPHGFGLYALVMAILTFTYIAVHFGVPPTVRRYVAEMDGRGERHLAGMVTGRGLRIGLGSALVGTFLLMAAAAPLASFFGQPPLRSYLLLGAALVVPMMGIAVLRGLIGGLQQYRFLVGLNLMTSPLWVGACVFALWIGAGVAGVILASLAVELINLLALGWYAYGRLGIPWRGRLPAELRARLVRYNWTLAALILVGAIVWQRSELLFLGRFSGPAQVSYYAIPFALTSRVAGLVPGAILGVLLPSLTYQKAAGDGARFGAVFAEALRYLAIVTLPICLLGIPLAPVIIRALYGPGFGPAAIVLQILLISVVFGVLGEASQSALLGAESQSWLLKTGLVAAVLSIGLDLALIPRWGAIGAAIANTTVQGAWALVIFAPLRSTWLHPLNRSRPLPAGGYVGH